MATRYRELRAFPPIPPHESRTSFGVATAILLLILSVVYLFSYAPVVRMNGGGWKMDPATDGYGHPATVHAPVYGEGRPVDWLIDNTPSQESLM